MLLLEEVFNRVLLLGQVLGHHLCHHCHFLPPSPPPRPLSDAKYQVDRDLSGRGGSGEGKELLFVYTGTSFTYTIWSSGATLFINLAFLSVFFIFHTFFVEIRDRWLNFSLVSGNASRTGLSERWKPKVLGNLVENMGEMPAPFQQIKLSSGSGCCMLTN